MNSKRILWVTPKWTLPVNDGARVATDSLIKNVIKAGGKADVFSFYDSTENVVISDLQGRWGVDEVFTVKKEVPEGKMGKMLFYLKHLLKSPKFPLTFAIYRNRNAKKRLVEVLNSKQYDLVILEGLHLAVTLLDESKYAFSTNGSKVILRAHNVESDLWEKAAQGARWPKSLFLNFQYNQVLKLEKLLLNLCDGVAAIAKEDEAVFKGWSHRPISYVPLGMNFEKPLPFTEIDPEQFVFIGRLDWMPNKQGLSWLLENVWPKVIEKRPTAKLNIVGVGDSSWLSAYLPMTGVKLVGKVANIQEAYLSAAFCVAPIFFGSGTRIKIIESFAMNRRLVSTRMGVQGAEVEGDMYVQAESIADWIQCLSKIQWNSEEANKLITARIRMAELFDERMIGERAFHWANSL